MMRVFMTMLCSLLAVCSVSARISRQEGTDGQAAIYRLPLFERAVRCTKYFEGWHSEKHHPYVGYGHRLLPGERYSARTMTKRQADALLRKDMRNFCAMFRQFGKDTFACHACLQCRTIPAFGERKDTQKLADPKAGGGRQEHLLGVYRLLQLQGKTPLHAAQTEEGGVCTAVCTIKGSVHKKSSLLRKCGGDDNFIMKLSYIFPNNYIF